MQVACEPPRTSGDDESGFQLAGSENASAGSLDNLGG
jgi:hypothetical protein